MATRRHPATTPSGSVGAAVISRSRHDAVIFDLDGVVTATAVVHAQAWRRMFDAFLAMHPHRPGTNHAPFTDADYERYVDGRSRVDGVATFLAARHIHLPFGDPTDPPDRITVCGLGNRKDRYFQAELGRHGVAAYPSSVALVRRLRQRGFGVAVVSASRNCVDVLSAAGLSDLFDARVDGVVAAELRLVGKPDPALFLEAARRLHVEPGRAVVVEDSEAGVAAGRRGGFALVVGVDRTGHGAQLRAHGADLVVADLAAVSVGDPPNRHDLRCPIVLWSVCDTLLAGRL